MKSYGFPTFNISKVLLTAEFIGRGYETIALDPGKGELRGNAAYGRAMQPFPNQQLFSVSGSDADG